MRSALVNDATYIVDNIIIADPVDPCPFEGQFMVGLQDPVYDGDVLITDGTACNIGWKYDPNTGTFAPVPEEGGP